MPKQKALLIAGYGAFITATVLSGQTRVSTAIPFCVKSLELPTRGLFAARAGTSGIVQAVVKINKNGQVGSLELVGENKVLRAEVEVAINLSKFEARCGGRMVEFVFAFTLEDPPTDNIVPPAVRFVPPNRFELTFRKVKPNID